MLTSAVLLVAASFAADRAEIKMPENIRAAMQYLVGKWDVEGNQDGEPFTATFTVRWASGKNCLIMTLRGNTENATAISGRDPSTNELVETLYLADGSRIENRYSHISEKVWEGISISQNPSGKTDRAQIRAEKTADGFTFTKKTETGSWS